MSSCPAAMHPSSRPDQRWPEWTRSERGHSTCPAPANTSTITVPEQTAQQHSTDARDCAEKKRRPRLRIGSKCRFACWSLRRKVRQPGHHAAPGFRQPTHIAGQLRLDCEQAAINRSGIQQWQRRRATPDRTGCGRSSRGHCGFHW